MGKRFWNKTNIFGLAGLLSYAVTTLVLFIPFREEPAMSLIDWRSPLGMFVLILFALSVSLYIWNIFRKEKTPVRLKRSELDSLIAQRNLYLIPIKEYTQQRLNIVDRLTIEAGQYPLEEYKKRYLPFHKNNKPLSIQNALTARQFIWNNHYYQLLKDKDSQLQDIISKYDICYSQIKDKLLKKRLKQLWDCEHMANSLKAFVLLSKGNQNISHTATGLNIALIGERINKDNVNNHKNRVFTRITELLDGEEDE